MLTDNRSNKAYRAGQCVQCPACKQESRIRIQTKMNGWQAVGQVAVCALCEHEFAAIAPDCKMAAADSTANRDRLAAFLATEVEARPKLPAEAAAPFCRNCRHFYPHVFKNACLLHAHDVDPNDDCAHYEAAAAKPENSDSCQ